MHTQNSTQHNAHPEYRKAYDRRAATKPEPINELKVQVLAVAPPLPPKRYLLQQRREMQEQLLLAKREQAAKARAEKLAKKRETMKPSKYGLENMKVGELYFFSGPDPVTLANALSSAGNQMEKITKLKYPVRRHIFEGVHGVGVWCFNKDN